MYHVYCPNTQTYELLDESSLLSTHLTSEGSVAYLRCRCGSLLVAGPNVFRLRHASHPARKQVGQGPATTATD